MLKKLAAGLAALLAVTLTACTNQNAPAPAPGEGGNRGEGQKFAVVMALGQLEFFDALKAGVSSAAAELGATWYFAGPQEFVPDQIAQAIDQAVASGATGIILHGQAAETAAAIDNAIDAGVPVIIVNTDIESKRLSFIGTNPYQAGIDMGNKMVELLDGKTGTVLISSALANGQPSALENLRGSKEALGKVPGLKVVEVDDTADANVAATNIGAALQANGDVVGIIGQQAYTAVGAATAVREAGKTGEVVIVGRDRDAATLELIDNGDVAASYAQNSFVEGYLATMWLSQYVNGSLQVVPDYAKAGINPLPNVVDSGSVVITKDNTELFREKYEYNVTAQG